MTHGGFWNESRGWLEGLTIISTPIGYEYVRLTIDFIVTMNWLKEGLKKKIGREYIPVTSWIEHVMFIAPIKLMSAATFKATSRIFLKLIR